MSKSTVAATPGMLGAWHSQIAVLEPMDMQQPIRKSAVGPLKKRWRRVAGWQLDGSITGRNREKQVYKSRQMSCKSIRRRDMGENMQNFAQLIQQVYNQQEAPTEIKICSSPRCRTRQVVQYTGLLFMNVIDHNCSYFLYLIIYWLLSGLMITSIPNLLDHFRDSFPDSVSSNVCTHTEQVLLLFYPPVWTKTLQRECL